MLGNFVVHNSAVVDPVTPPKRPSVGDRLGIGAGVTGLLREGKPK